MKYSFVVVFLCAAAIFKTAESISCYSCHSLRDVGCEPFNSSLIDAVNCDKYYPGATGCIAHAISIGNLNYTTRGCANNNSNDTLSFNYVRNEANQKNYTVNSSYTCSLHLCNSATSFGGNVLGVLVVTTVFGVIMGKVL